MNYTKNIAVSLKHQGGNPSVSKLVKQKNEYGITFYFIVDNQIMFKSDLDYEANYQFRLFVNINKYERIYSSDLDLY
jgi:hypothetical protein